MNTTVTVKNAAEYHDFFASIAGPLAANGYRVRTEGGDLIFSESAAAHLAHLDEFDDGIIDAEGMWIGGTCYEVVR